MFCERCGTRIEDGAPFCPNCGNRMPVSPGSEKPLTAEPKPEPRPEPKPEPKPVPKPMSEAQRSAPDPLAFVDQNLPLLRYVQLGLLVLCFVFSLLRVFSVYGSSLNLNLGAPWLLVLGNVLYTLCIAALVLELSGKTFFRFRRLLTAAAAVILLLLYVVKWIAGFQGFGIRLTLAGWLFLLLQLLLAALSVLLLLRDKK